MADFFGTKFDSCRRRALSRSVLLALGAAASGIPIAFAQSYPSRAIRIIEEMIRIATAYQNVSTLLIAIPMRHKIEQVFRDRPLTPDEASRDETIRRAVLVEYPPVTTTCSSNLRIADRVAEFAKRHGLEDVLPLVIDLTERLFPMAQAVDVELVADDEQSDQQTIFFKVQGLDIEPRLGSDLHWQWASELQQICTGPGRALLGLELCWVD